MYELIEDDNKGWNYNRRQQAFEDIKEGWVVCPKCGNEEIYYENPRSGNGLYNCDYCGYAAHDRKFKHLRFKVRKCILKRWHK